MNSSIIYETKNEQLLWLRLKHMVKKPYLVDHKDSLAVIIKLHQFQIMYLQLDMETLTGQQQFIWQLNNY